MSTKTFSATIVPAAGGLPIEVKVPANNSSQATKIVESLYGPVRNWYQHPREVRETTTKR